VSDGFVIDASIGLAWVHPSQATPESDALLADVESGARVMVPAIWFAETANALLVLERRKKLTRGERAKALSRLGDLNILPDEDGHRFVFSSVSEVASKQGLSVYDASYLELAVRRGLPFASRDEAVKAAAEKCGLVVR